MFDSSAATELKVALKIYGQKLFKSLTVKKYLKIMQKPGQTDRQSTETILLFNANTEQTKFGPKKLTVVFRGLNLIQNKSVLKI